MKRRRVYVCQQCGNREPKWLGRCPTCQAWSSLVEEEEATGRGARETRTVTVRATPIARVEHRSDARTSTGIPELDRVLGGGLVRGALVLVGGDPGIGKSTLLLQAMGQLAADGAPVLYLTAEESLQQVKLRAERIGLLGNHSADNLLLLADTRIEALEAAWREVKPVACVVDSVQTVGIGEVESPVGSVSQIRAVTAKLMELAKGHDLTTFVVGHVTKEGAIAGPKVMEHMVDTVLYFEGERTGPYRLLRAHKNRFGSAQEIGVFEMHGDGLRAVANPSELFLSQRADGPGAAVVTSLEGSRPILVEVQALTTAALYGNPRRTTIGFDQQRVAMLCAVLSARAGLDLGALDVYVNIAGGVRISEPAADLGVIAALASAAAERTLPSDTVLVGEVGLSGEVRAAASVSARVQEAASLGFSRCLVPRIDVERWQGEPPAIPIQGVATISETLDLLGMAV